MRILRRALVPFAAALLGATLGGVAVASIPGSDGVISGCYSKVTGALRVINAPTQTCPRAQVAISWSQTGPQGATGAQGPPGPGDVIGGSLDTAYGSNPDPEDGPWTTFLAIPGVADVQLGCGTYGDMALNLLNTSGGNLLFGGGGLPNELGPGGSAIVDNLGSATIPASPILVNVAGGSEVVTITAGGETGVALPTNDGECHAYGQAVVTGSG